MKQVLQNLKSGETELAEIPAPLCRPGHLLIATRRTLISAGTERMLVEFSQSNLLAKARSQPDKVRQVLDKVKTDGILATVEAVRRKLDQPLALGYCNAGVVLEVGEGVSGFAVGDRVVSNGPHAEIVCVPKNLCARIPDDVSDDEAAFTVLAAVGLQGIRLANPTLGEAVVVTGLGLLGLMTVQMLIANGCRVLGIDLDPHKCGLARQFGADTLDLSTGADPVAAGLAFSHGHGVDAVLITAATKSSVPVHQAAQMCRKRGRIVLIGVTGLDLSRDDFYKKELSFQVSCSYGPGRYDKDYEEKGHDYPFGFVRWTAQRNFEAVLDLMAKGRLDVKPLISHRFPINEAEKAYELICSDEPSLGILLTYPDARAQPDNTVSVARRPIQRQTQSVPVGKVCVSCIGAGNYATSVLIPAFKKAGARLRSVASVTGVSAVHAARKFGFEEATTDVEHLFSDPETNAIVITTRHDSHGRLVLQALRAGKHVFVEKPLCLTLEELEQIDKEYSAMSEQGKALPTVMVGFNRRFSPLIQKVKSLLSTVRGPKALVMTINAGAIPKEHWTQDPQIGGGRIIGEACHFVDLLRYLVDAPIVTWNDVAMEAPTSDTRSISLTFSDGSIGTIHYLANGSRAFPKERLEVFASGRVLQLDNFRRLRGFDWPGFSKTRLWRQDKGQVHCVRTFVEAVERGGPPPIPFDQIIEVSKVTIQIARQASGFTNPSS